jgi:hypothetical protein
VTLPGAALPGFCVLRSASMKMNWLGGAAQVKGSEFSKSEYRKQRIEPRITRISRIQHRKAIASPIRVIRVIRG